MQGFIVDKVLIATMKTDIPWAPPRAAHEKGNSYPNALTAAHLRLPERNIYLS